MGMMPFKKEQGEKWCAPWADLWARPMSATVFFLLGKICPVRFGDLIAPMQTYGRNQISGQCSGFRFQQTINPDTRNLTPLSLMIQKR